jgi:GNAT superfamily N-acetyltransferase
MARPVVIRAKVEADAAGVLDLLLRVHATDGYPLHVSPEQVPVFLRSGHEVVAWVAEQDGRIVGHVALHWDSADATLASAQRATSLPIEQFLMVARLFVAPELHGTGLGRNLLRHAAAQAQSLERRAVLNVAQALLPAVALYDAEGWTRVDALQLAVAPDTVLDLWVYVSPEPVVP